MANKEEIQLPNLEFSIIKGGLLDRLLFKLHIAIPNSESSLRKIIFFIAIAWLPLVLLSLLEGLFFEKAVDIPFVVDFAIHIRLVVALPLLFLAESIVDNRVKITLNQFNHSGLLTETGRLKFEKAKTIADQMCESFWAESIIILLIISNLIFRVFNNDIALSTWAFPETSDTAKLSLAGYWAVFLSFPIFQFIFLRWFWRWIIWFRLLHLISRSDLHLIPAHPDKSGGLGFLGESPLPFGMFTFVLSIVFSSILAERLLFQNFVVQDFREEIIVFVMLCITINIAPLVTFMKPLTRARMKGISDYHALIAKHHQNFESKWIKKEKQLEENILGNADASSMADISTVYNLVESMTLFPFNLRTMFLTIIISIIPVAFLFVMQLPFSEVLKLLAGILL
jgi:hypothetical protein